MTVLEVASLHVKDGAEEDFEAAFESAKGYLNDAQGCVGAELTRSITRSCGYVLLVRWRSLADHVEGFVATGAFTNFKDLIWPYFVSDPDVLHFDEITEEIKS